METIKIWWAGGDKFFNYGDAITPYLVRKISGKEPILTPKNNKETVYLVIGSILSQQGTFPNCEVWGSGVISKDMSVKQGVKFHAVRGPLTREILLRGGHVCPEIYGDPALLLPRYYTPKSDKKYKLGVIPHYIDYADIKKRYSEDDSLVIDFTYPDVEYVTDQINSCDYIISSSLHGVIVAQAYGIPALWVKFSNKLSGDDIKFYDYFASVGIGRYTPPNYLTKKTISEAELLSHFEKYNQHLNIVSFDYDKLLESCPFKKE